MEAGPRDSTAARTHASREATGRRRTTAGRALSPSTDARRAPRIDPRADATPASPSASCARRAGCGSGSSPRSSALGALGSLMFAFPLAFEFGDGGAVVAMLGLLICCCAAGWGIMAARRVGHTWPGLPAAAPAAARTGASSLLYAVIVGAVLAVARRLARGPPALSALGAATGPVRPPGSRTIERHDQRAARAVPQGPRHRERLRDRPRPGRRPRAVRRPPSRGCATGGPVSAGTGCCASCGRRRIRRPRPWPTRPSGSWTTATRDGSVAEMCGNGVRVFARYLQRAGLAGRGRLAVATRAGVRRVHIAKDAATDARSPSAWGRARLPDGEVTVRVGDRSWPARNVEHGQSARRRLRRRPRPRRRPAGRSRREPRSRLPGRRQRRVRRRPRPAPRRDARARARLRRDPLLRHGRLRRDGRRRPPRRGRPGGRRCARHVHRGRARRAAGDHRTARRRGRDDRPRRDRRRGPSTRLAA